MYVGLYMNKSEGHEWLRYDFTTTMSVSIALLSAGS